MLFKELKARLEANNMYCLCTKELVTNVDEILLDKEIKRDKPSLYTLQRLSATKQATNFGVTMLEDINNVLSHMIDDTRYPDLVRYNNIIEAKLSEYEKILDKNIEYKGIDTFYAIQKYTDELLLYGVDCYKLAEDILHKIVKLIVDDNSILQNCSNSSLIAFNSLMGDDYKRLVDSYSKCVNKSNEALHNFAGLLNNEAV